MTNKILSGSCAHSLLSSEATMAVPLSALVPSATADHQFSLQNLPYGIFSTSSNPNPRVGVAVGDFVLDMSLVSFLFPSLPVGVFSHPTLNAFMELDSSHWKATRALLLSLLTGSSSGLTAGHFVPLSSVTMHLPARIGDYTDFYSSREHATNVGIMFRDPTKALQPNWLHLPVGYHGRSSSVFLSGTDVVRPAGQLQADVNDESKGSVHAPCKTLDFELEMGFFVGGAAKAPGATISMSEAEGRIFGVVLLNDWSARDIQKWEYVPLGPFGAKNFATTISPWVVTLEALEPYRCPTSAVTQSDPVPLPYLQDPTYSSYDVALTVSIKGANMPGPEVVSRSNFRYMYWNMKQQLVHHSVTGCNMQPADLLGSGTISGETTDSYGSMLELCWKGTKDVKLGETGETRKFLRDGDEVTMEGVCRKQGVGAVGFGSCTGRILPVGSELKAGGATGLWVQK